METPEHMEAFEEMEMEKEGEGEEIVLKEEDLNNPALAGDDDNFHITNDLLEEKAMAAASRYKEEGNALFATQKFQEASITYRKGLALLPGPSNDPDCRDLQISLRSNLAMSLLKLGAYAESERECSVILENWDGSVAKVWYRRALAREFLASSKGNDHFAEQYLRLALEDLEQSITLLNEQNQDVKMTNAAKHALERVQTQMRAMSEMPQSAANMKAASLSSTRSLATNNGTNGHFRQTDGSSTTTPTSEPTIARPQPLQQRQDIMKLLIARSVGLQKAPTADHPVVGEALFLMDWKWWCQWCRHVDFYHINENGEKHDRILKLLPPGAILPPKKKDDDNNSTDSSDSEDLVNNHSPGMIDNTYLLLPSKHLRPATDNHNSQTQPNFYRQWYKHFQCRETSRKEGIDDHNNNKFSSEEQRKVSLRPNLVRGFHFELLPREVYCALRSWYGEKTPSICRRTVLDRPNPPDEQNQSREPTVCLPLYPLSESAPDIIDVQNKSNTQDCAACRARYASKRCTRCRAVCYCDKSCQESHWTYHKAFCRKAESGAAEQPPDHYVSDGRVGLHQLGNTCFMNSALQCLSHATPLTRHFLSNQFKHDLNDTNPLGTGGKLAMSFETVLKDLWMKPNITSTTPTALKRAIAIFAPRFAGCLQHDAQEFLAYLLDGLHEDLNRIKKPPYVEMPDADSHGANMAVAGAEAWECHLQRNDSLVMDTFYGQFKSTCVCPNPNCGRVSVSFDAFNHISLEIPQMQKSTIWIPIMVFYNPTAAQSKNNKILNNSPHVMRYAVCVRTGSTIADLRQALSQLCGVPTTHLVLCVVSDHCIVEILHDNKPVTAIPLDGMVAAYQVDPYTNLSIHVVVTHALVEPGVKTGEDDEDVEQIDSEYRQLFGYPFMTSCGADLTCRELYQFLWQFVGRMVMPVADDGSEESIDPELEDVYRHLFVARITDADGTSIPLFPLESDHSKTEREFEEKGEGESLYLSPYVPRDVDETISMYLGEDCTKKFLFLSLDWKESSVVPSELLEKASRAVINTGGNNKKKKKTKKSSNSRTKDIPKVVRIEEQRFNAFSVHPSFPEGMRKERAMNAANGVTLDQCFETFTKPERLDEHNMWYCSNCKEHVRALKTMELWRLPNILVVHLKRFEFRNGFRRDKLTTLVDFPLNGLDMSQHCAKWRNENDYSGSTLPEQLYVDDSVPAVYDLFGVVNHYGRMGFGHYTAFARKWDEADLSNDWALFDDSSVRSVGDGRGANGVDGVVSPAAYVLFYRRRTFN